MKFVANGVKYDFDDSKMTFAEGRAIEEKTGRSMDEIRKTGGGDLTTMQATIWVAMKRQDPTLRFADLDDMAIGDIEWVSEEEIPPVAGEAGGAAGPIDVPVDPDGASTATE